MLKIELSIFSLVFKKISVLLSNERVVFKELFMQEALELDIGLCAIMNANSLLFAEQPFIFIL